MLFDTGEENNGSLSLSLRQSQHSRREQGRVNTFFLTHLIALSLVWKGGIAFRLDMHICKWLRNSFLDQSRFIFKCTTIFFNTNEVLCLCTISGIRCNALLSSWISLPAPPSGDCAKYPFPSHRSEWENVDAPWTAVQQRQHVLKMHHLYFPGLWHRTSYLPSCGILTENLTPNQFSVLFSLTSWSLGFCNVFFL